MSSTLTLILGDQLFEGHPAFESYYESKTDFVMIESRALCSRFRYHKLKLAYIITCMRNYADFLRKTYPESKVHYYKFEDDTEFETVLKELGKTYSKVQYCEISDKGFRSTVEKLTKDTFEQVQVLESPMFLTSRAQFKYYLSTSKAKKRRLMADFYVWQRRRLHLFVDQKGEPLNNAWSFDADNRKKLPKTVEIPERPEFKTTSENTANWDDVFKLIESEFPDNPGTLEHKWLAMDHAQAESVLDFFLDNLLAQFGDYEDALSDRDPYLFHSTLSPYLNNGLLTPEFVLQKLLTKVRSDVLLMTEHYNSVEGFVRQIIGWREWIKGMYDNFYEPDKNYNFFDARDKLPEYFYFKDIDAVTNPPLQQTLSKIEKYGWAHHIERLMVLGNYMTLSEIDPKEAYDWFMAMFVDAYDWVMVPNVYGMGTFADGGIFATKPYISGSNYLKKMGDYPSGDWEQEWTDLFWKFLQKHEDFFIQQPRLAMLLRQKKFKDEDEKSSSKE